MKRKQVVKVRNPLVVAMVNRQGGGSHQRSEKAKRRDEKVALKKQKDWVFSSPFFIGASNFAAFVIRPLSIGKYELGLV